MRGKEKRGKSVDTDQRITPAYAGKSSQADSHLQFPQDHPRLCGEKVQLGIQGLKRVGSPPPMRGKD